MCTQYNVTYGKEKEVVMDERRVRTEEAAVHTSKYFGNGSIYDGHCHKLTIARMSYPL